MRKSGKFCFLILFTQTIVLSYSIPIIQLYESNRQLTAVNQIEEYLYLSNGMVVAEETTGISPLAADLIIRENYAISKYPAKHLEDCKLVTFILDATKKLEHWKPAKIQIIDNPSLLSNRTLYIQKLLGMSNLYQFIIPRVPNSAHIDIMFYSTNGRIYSQIGIYIKNNNKFKLVGIASYNHFSVQNKLRIHWMTQTFYDQL